MISFRHHVVSLVAVLLALAAGVALGGGPLQELGRGADSELQSENAELRAELTSTRSAGGLAEALVEEQAPALAKGLLADSSVAVLALPGADPGTVADLEELVTVAGGRSAGRFQLGADAYRASGKAMVDTLGAQLAAKADAIPADATTYERLGHLVGRAVTSDDTTLRSSLAAADLLVADEAAGTADLVLVVLGTGDRPADAPALAAVLTGLDQEVDGTVVAASSATAATGLLPGLRSDPTMAGVVSTTDGAESLAGQLVAVRALAADADGETGHWGTRGESGPTPDPAS